MTPDIFWVRDVQPLRLAIMPKPRPGDWLLEEIEGYDRAGITTLVSLLEPHEVAELGLQEEQKLCAERGIEFVSHPIVDRGVPVSTEKTHQLVAALIDKLQAGAGVAIHCRAGIGRSGLIAACVLSGLGFTPKRAFTMLSTARRVSVPDTAAQEEWVIRHAPVMPDKAAAP